jgi:hypothetical protein
MRTRSPDNCTNFAKVSKLVRIPAWPPTPTCGRSPGGERGRASGQVWRTATTAATNLHDALSARRDRSSAMRCRKKLSDALSVRRYP